MVGDHLWIAATGSDDSGGLLIVWQANQNGIEFADIIGEVGWGADVDFGVVEPGYYWAQEQGNGVAYSGLSALGGPVFYNP